LIKLDQAVFNKGREIVQPYIFPFFSRNQRHFRTHRRKQEKSKTVLLFFSTKNILIFCNNSSRCVQNLTLNNRKKKTLWHFKVPQKSFPWSTKCQVLFIVASFANLHWKNLKFSQSKKLSNMHSLTWRQAYKLNLVKKILNWS